MFLMSKINTIFFTPYLSTLFLPLPLPAIQAGREGREVGLSHSYDDNYLLLSWEKEV